MSDDFNTRFLRGVDICCWGYSDGLAGGLLSWWPLELWECKTLLWKGCIDFEVSSDSLVWFLEWRFVDLSITALSPLEKEPEADEATEGFSVGDVDSNKDSYLFSKMRDCWWGGERCLVFLYTLFFSGMIVQGFFCGSPAVDDRISLGLAPSLSHLA